MSEKFVRVTLDFPNAAEAAAALALLAGNVTAAPKPAAQASGGRAAAAAPASTRSSTAAVKDETVKTLDYEKDFKPHIVAAGAKHGREGIVAFLTETFGVAGGKDIKPEQLTAENQAKLIAFKEKEADVA